MRPDELSYEVAGRDGPQDRLLLLLHGYGEPASSMLERLDVLDPEARFLAVAPTAPFDKDGRPVWHRAMGGGSEIALAELWQSLDALDRLLDALEAETGLSRAAAIVGGFSQGGGLGYGLLLSANVACPPSAAFGICSFPPAIPGFEVDLTRVAGRPVLLTAAQQDHFAPIEMSQDNAAVLAELGLHVSYHETESEHVLTDQACALAGRWLTEVHAGGSPSTSVPRGNDTRDSYLRGYRNTSDQT